MAESTIPFPGNSVSSLNIAQPANDNRSLWNRASALDVHRTLYSLPVENEAPVEQLERVKSSLEKLYERDAVYENPIITASSCSVITDIHSLVHRLLQVDVPTPRSLLSSLILGGHVPSDVSPLLHVSKAWSEIMDISESDGFDRSQKVHLEHIVHLPLLPGLHSTDPGGTGDNASSDALDVMSTTSLTVLQPQHNYNHHSSHPRLNVLGTKLPSPFHFKLRVLSRLSFNEAGKITHHRDMWDVKDLVRAVVPGARLALWVTSRLGGHGLAAVSRLAFWAAGGGRGAKEHGTHGEGHRGGGATDEYQGTSTDPDEGRNALGLLGLLGFRHDTTTPAESPVSRGYTSPYQRSQAFQHGNANQQHSRRETGSLASFRRSSSYGTSVDVP